MSDLREKLADAKARRESDDGCQCPLGSGFLPQRQHAETCARNEVAQLRAALATERAARERVEVERDEARATLTDTKEREERDRQAWNAQFENAGAALLSERTAREAAEADRDAKARALAYQEQRTREANDRFVALNEEMHEMVPMLRRRAEAAEAELAAVLNQLPGLKGNERGEFTAACARADKAEFALKAAEAGAAGLREALEKIAGHFDQRGSMDGNGMEFCVYAAKAALRDPTGQTLLERLALPASDHDARVRRDALEEAALEVQHLEISSGEDSHARRLVLREAEAAIRALAAETKAARFSPQAHCWKCGKPKDANHYLCPSCAAAETKGDGNG